MLRRFAAKVSAAMNPEKVVREKVRRFTDLPNIGPASARDFVLLGFTQPGQLEGADPLQLYETLCRITGSRQDPCVLDVFMSVTDFLDGHPPRPWWHYTDERKRKYGRLHADGGNAPPAAGDPGKPARRRGAV